MKIAYVHCNFWPYVRRGAERFTFELASYMTRQGHTVDVIATKPGPNRVGYHGDVRVIYQRQHRHPLAQGWRWGFMYVYMFGLTVLPALLARSYDIIHCWLYMYGPASYLATRLRGGCYIYHNMSPAPHYYPHIVDRLWFEWSLRRAEAVLDLTRPAADQLSQDYGVTVDVIPPPVNLGEFQITPGKNLEQPHILFASSLTAPIKGLEILIRAFNYVHRRCPQAVLQLAGPEEWKHIPSHLWELLDSPKVRDSVQLIGAGSLVSLPNLYAQAAVTVLPSLYEPFGMVLLESLASGTPVVSTNNGGPAEIVTPEVGILVEINSMDHVYSDAKAQELANAILRSIELGKNPATAHRCRERARLWDVETIGGKTEALYREVM